MSSKMNK